MKHRIRLTIELEMDIESQWYEEGTSIEQMLEIERQQCQNIPDQYVGLFVDNVTRVEAEFLG